MTNPDLRFDDRIVLITGSSRGLGRAMALGFAEAGADVVVTSRKIEACEVVADEIRAMGRRALAVGCHVGDWHQCSALVERVIDEFGRVDVLINNAGMAPVPPSISDITEELFDKTVGVNLKGPVRITGLVAPHMPEGSSIINISSTASTKPNPATVVYAAAKAGLNAFTRAAAVQYGPRGIRVNAIVCGPFLTDSLAVYVEDENFRQALEQRIGLGRFADPSEIVGTALWMAGDAASYLHGALVTLDGGSAA